MRPRIDQKRGLLPRRANKRSDTLKFMRKTVALFMLISMLAQAAMAGQLSMHGSAASLAHAALHWNAEAHHHHHDDGAFHQDGSDESIQHVQADGCLNAASLPARFHSHGLAVVPSAASDLDAGPAPPVPFLEGLKRPPRPAA